VLAKGTCNCGRGPSLGDGLCPEMMDWCDTACQSELMSAVTMLPPILACNAGIWAASRRTICQSSVGCCLLAGALFLLPFSVWNHVSCAMNGEHDRRLLQLDQLGISVITVCVSWALAKSTVFTALVVMLAALVDVVMFFGPDHTQDDVTWRMVCLGMLNCLALSPMVWCRDACDWNILPILFILPSGLALAVFAPIGAYSHPMFHLLGVPHSYFIARSAKANELRLENCNRLFSLEESNGGTTDTDTTYVRETEDKTWWTLPW